MATCWFCKNDKAGSREHMFPKWLNEVIPGQIERFIDVQENQKTDSDFHRREWVRSGPAKETVKSVCKDCNNGWMAQLEYGSKLVLSPLIRGEKAVVKGIDLVLVATWATKTAIVIESRNPPTQYVSTPDTREIVMNELRPPASTQVDAFTIEGEPLSGYWRYAANITHGSTPDQPGISNYAVTMMKFGHLGLRVIDDRATMHDPLSGLNAPKIPGVVTIYPSISTLNWPLLPVLKHTDLKAIRMASLSGITNFIGPVSLDDWEPG